MSEYTSTPIWPELSLAVIPPPVTEIWFGRVVGGGVFEQVVVAGLCEGACAGANGIVAGLSGQKINAPMNKKGLFPPKKHTPPVTETWPFGSKIDSITGGYTVTPL